MQKQAGIVLIVGSLMFIIAAFTPTTIRVITTSDPQKRSEIIENEKIGWLLVNLLFGLGSVAAVIGLTLFGLHVQSLTANASVKFGGYIAIAAAGIAALFWVITVYNRVVVPPQELAGSLSINSWIFPAYTILTQIALMIVGFMLIQSGYPTWLGWGMLVLAGLSLVAFLVFKDMPPFAHYVLLLIMGIALVR